jgi:hypothetical protein
MSPTPEEKAREVTFKINHNCAERPQQEILKTAFSGKLVSNPKRQGKFAPLPKGVAP